MPLRVELAGFNLDCTLLEEARGFLGRLLHAPAADDPAFSALQEEVRTYLDRENWTPETLSAAYARISRDPSAVDELRARARAEVDRARRSNETIVFGLGHSSVAEHAVFNFDILGLSRLAVEALERRRLASFTEKSQRYILLEEDWVLPKEIQGTAVEDCFRQTIAAQNEFYRAAYERLLPHVLERHPEEAADKKSRRTLEGLAKEDARYGLSLATTVQLGMTVNARTLEGLVARCRAHGLREVRDLADAVHGAVGGLAPSLVKYTEPTPYLREARARLADVASALRGGPAGEEADTSGIQDSAVRLVSCTPEADREAASVLLYAGGFGDLESCRKQARELDPARLESLFRSGMDLLGPHDALLREFEHIELTYDLVVSATCYAQLKRHRMATITPLEYDPALGVTVPGAFDETGLTDPFLEVARKSEECHTALRKELGASGPDQPLPAASYILTNAHRRRVLMKVNARELLHISRLREDIHAQWDIRRLAEAMVALARERMPLTLSRAGGKDRFGIS